MRLRSLITAALCGVLAFGLTTCASIDKAALARIKSAAVISVYCDKKVKISDTFDWFASVLSEGFQSDKFQLKEIVQKLKYDLFINYAKILPFTLVDEGKVLDAPKYKELISLRQSGASTFSIPDGYTLVSVMNTDDFKNATAYVPADAAVVLQATYLLQKATMGDEGDAVVNATVWLVVKDASGRDILNRFASADSKETIKFELGGLFDATRLINLCGEATDLASRDLLAGIQADLK